MKFISVGKSYLPICLPAPVVFGAFFFCGDSRDNLSQEKMFGEFARKFILENMLRFWQRKDRREIETEMLLTGSASLLHF